MEGSEESRRSRKNHPRLASSTAVLVVIGWKPNPRHRSQGGVHQTSVDSVDSVLRIASFFGAASPELEGTDGGLGTVLGSRFNTRSQRSDRSQRENRPDRSALRKTGENRALAAGCLHPWVFLRERLKGLLQFRFSSVCHFSSKRRAKPPAGPADGRRTVSMRSPPRTSQKQGHIRTRCLLDGWRSTHLLWALCRSTDPGIWPCRLQAAHSEGLIVQSMGVSQTTEAPQPKTFILFFGVFLGISWHLLLQWVKKKLSASLCE